MTTKDGFLLIDKDKNISSHSVIKPIKKLLNTKVGHTGTLDPMATGMIVCAVGQARKFIQFAQIKAKKYYKATVQLGIKTDTADITGNEIKKCNVRPLNLKTIESIIQKKFIGIIEQTPPAYSALKYKGKPYYTYARKGKDIPIAKRTIHIESICHIKYDDKNQQICFDALVGSGTYIRTLAEDIAGELGTVGCLKELRRIYVEPWKDTPCHSMDELKTTKDIHSLLIPIEKSLIHLKKIYLSEEDIIKLKHGIKLERKKQSTCEEPLQVYQSNDSFQGIIQVRENTIRPLKMLPLATDK